MWIFWAVFDDQSFLLCFPSSMLPCPTSIPFGIKSKLLPVFTTKYFQPPLPISFSPLPHTQLWYNVGHTWALNYQFVVHFNFSGEATITIA